MNLDQEIAVLSNTFSKPVILCCFSTESIALLTSFYSLAR